MPVGPRGVPRFVPSSEDGGSGGAHRRGHMPTLEGWIAKRPRTVPSEFLDHLNTEVPLDADVLLAEAERGLERSLEAQPDEPHERAFDLLRADALITYACQGILVEDKDPRERLRLLAARLSRGG